MIKAALLAGGAALRGRAIAARAIAAGQTALSLGAFTVNSASALAARMRVNATYPLSLDLDRLLYSFRVYARLPTRGVKPYAGWEGSDWGARHHFVDHYLSAISKAALTMAPLDPAVAAAFRARVSAMVAAFAECQAANARLQGPNAPGRAGYLNAQSPAQFDRLEALQPCDVPYYVVHKIMAGLLDAFTLIGDRQALVVARGMADYFAWRMDRLSDERIAAMTETRRYTGRSPNFFSRRMA